MARLLDRSICHAVAGQNALMTDAGGSMVAAIALRFAQAGGALVLTDISGNWLQATVDALRMALPGVQIVSRRADALIEAEAEAAAVSTGYCCCPS